MYCLGNSDTVTQLPTQSSLFSSSISPGPVLSFCFAALALTLSRGILCELFQFVHPGAGVFFWFSFLSDQVKMAQQKGLTSADVGTAQEVGA